MGSNGGLVISSAVCGSITAINLDIPHGKLVVVCGRRQR